VSAGASAAAKAPAAWQALFEPRGIAVIGASRDLRRIGGQPVKFLSTYGYPGKVYPVNPNYEEIAGLKCYPNARAIDGPCDVALIAVNARAVPDALRDCGAKGVRFAIVLSSGFRETGASGAALEREMLAVAREHGIRVIGPNCQGYLNLASRMYATFGVLGLEPELKRGAVSTVSQSGGFGFGIVTQCEAAGVGFRYIVSSGNESDLNTPELLGAYVEDEGTRILVGYIEGVRDGRELMRVADRAVRAGKPLLMWKTGNSDAGKRASLSHTAPPIARRGSWRCATSTRSRMRRAPSSPGGCPGAGASRRWDRPRAPASSSPTAARSWAWRWRRSSRRPRRRSPRCCRRSVRRATRWT